MFSCDLKTGGESGIRTHVTLSSKHAFQACAFSHSAISPRQSAARQPAAGGELWEAIAGASQSTTESAAIKVLFVLFDSMARAVEPQGEDVGPHCHSEEAER